MHFDNDISYWSANPQHKIIFNDIYKPDTSRDKKRSSTFMYGIALMFHVDSSIYDWRYEDKLELIKSSIWKNYSNEFEGLIPLVKDRMERLDGGDTSGMRQMREWNRIMDEKTNYLKTMKYDSGTFETIEKMLKSNGILYAEYERIMQVLMKEDVAADKTFGGSEESFVERGDMNAGKQA